MEPVIATGLSLFVGFSAASIGFTAWPLLVPLAVVLLRASVPLAILMSLSVDATTGLTTALSHMRGGLFGTRPPKMRFGLALFAALLALVGGIPLVLAVRKWHEAAETKKLFSGGSSYALFFVSAFFAFKAYREPSSTEKAPSTSRFAIANLEKLESSERRRHRAKAVRLASDPLEESLLADESSDDVEQDPAGSGDLDDLECEFPDERISSRRFPFSCMVCSRGWGLEPFWRASRIKQTTFVVAAILCGVGAGLLGMGLGTAFVLLFSVILEIDLVEATGAGCMAMGVLSIGLSFTFIDKTQDVLPVALTSSWLAAVISGCFGALFGAELVSKIEKKMLLVTIAIVLLAGGIAATIQAMALKGSN